MPTGDLHFSRGRPSPRTVLSGRETGRRELQAVLWVEGQEKKTSFEDCGEGERGKGGGGARIVCRSVTQRNSQGLRPPGEGGHPSTRVVGSERRAGLCASAPDRNQGVLQARERAPDPVSSPPHFPGDSGWVGGVQKAAAGPGGAPGRAHHPGLRPQQAGRAVGEAGRGGRRSLGHCAPAFPPWPSGAPSPRPPPQYLHGTTEESARVGRQLLHVEVHNVHPGRQPGGGAG